MVLAFFYRLPLGGYILLFLLIPALWAILTLTAGYSVRRKRVWRYLNWGVFIIAVVQILKITIFDRFLVIEDGIHLLRTWEELAAKPELIREMAMNGFLFLPLGLSLTVLQEKSRGGVLRTILTAAGISLTVEIIQYMGKIGYCELTDLLCNILGAAAGALWIPIQKTKPAKIIAGYLDRKIRK